MSNQQNDLSLLRPFNLEAAKNGESFLFACVADKVQTELEFIDERQGSMVFHDGYQYRVAILSYPEHMTYLRMKPLCWVENKPVYKGDTLWNTENRKTSIKVDAGDSEGRLYGYCEEDKCPASSEINTVTWNKPKQKVKRKVWINVYPDGDLCSYYSKIDADAGRSPERIACVETEIEYEV